MAAALGQAALAEAAGGMRPVAMAAERSKLASAPIEAAAETVSVTVLVEHALA